MRGDNAKRAATVPASGKTPADVIAARNAAWAARPLLRAVYRDALAAIGRELAPGARTVEVGGGSGMAREFLAGLLVTDLVATPHVDLVADATRLPFPAASVDNLIGIDCLHHLPRPATLFAEAARTLRPGGRLVLIEPYISPVSRLVFALAHPEPVDLAVDPLPAGDRAVFAPGGPFAANQAIPTLLFFRHRARLAARFPELRLRTRRRMSTIAYPLSGGFSGPAWIPAWAAGAVWTLERLSAPLAPLMAFRLLVTLERTTTTAAPAARSSPAPL
jgi:SAM-dependent methyltransferase